MHDPFTYYVAYTIMIVGLVLAVFFLVAWLHDLDHERRDRRR